MIKLKTFKTIKELQEYKKDLPKSVDLKNPVDLYYTVEGAESALRLIEDAPKPKVHAQDLLMKEGGDWLGVVRDWIQCRCVNGSDVTWGSDDTLRPNGGITVRDLEGLASRVAAAAINEYVNKRER